MKKILLSLSMIVFVGAIVIGATGAFFSDTETSTGNTFTAGAIDLKVDSQCHYYQMNASGQYVDVHCPNGVGSWSQKDLNSVTDQFFKFSDIKPGDKGEDTISLHVLNNDAWGKFSISAPVGADISCTEPEGATENYNNVLNTCAPNGNLRENLKFSIFLDQGSTPGFQNHGDLVITDLTEGDNIQQTGEPTIVTSGTLDANGEAYLLSTALASVKASTEACNSTSPDGQNNYGSCQGLAVDGRMVGSTNYQFGLNWELPIGTTNEVQTDSMTADITFNVVQHRNNPTQSGL